MNRAFGIIDEKDEFVHESNQVKHLVQGVIFGIFGGFFALLILKWMKVEQKIVKGCFLASLIKAAILLGLLLVSLLM